jgi:hypothetical protein
MRVRRDIGVHHRVDGVLKEVEAERRETVAPQGHPHWRVQDFYTM